MENLTELVFILDRSGSMGGLESDTIGGFNAMIEKQRREPGRALVSTILFDSESSVLHDRIDLAEVVPKMTEADYTVGGCTALVDAIGGAIRHIADIHKYARREDVPEHTLFVITTDGMENASRRYSADEVRKMIGRQKEAGWEFLFIGANIDAVETAKRYGIGKDRAANYKADGRGTEILYECVAAAVSQVRSHASLSAKWNEEMEEDLKKRG